MDSNAVRIEQTSAGRVVNASHGDINDIFSAKFGPRWIDYRRRWAEASRMETLEDFPLFVRFETQFKCNGRCRMCAHGHPDLKSDYHYTDYLSFDVFTRLVDECAEFGCPSVGMSQTNEPLLDPDLFERIDYVTTKGIMDIHLNSNGQLLTKEISEKILASGITRLCISLDAVSGETYSKIRPGLDFDTVVENLNIFLDLRAKKQIGLPVVRVSFLLQEENQHELDEFKARWVNRVDYVSVQRYVPISPFDDERSHAIDTVPIRGEQKCSYPFESLFIHGDGTVVPCAAHRARHISVGNIHKNTIHEIWHSKAMKELRAALKSGELQNTLLCSSCLF